MAYVTAARWYIVGEKESKVHVWSHQMTWTKDSGMAATYQHPSQAALVLDGLQRMMMSGRTDGIKEIKCLRVEDLDRLLMQQTLIGISDGDF